MLTRSKMQVWSSGWDLAEKWMRFSRVCGWDQAKKWMRSSRVVRASDSQFRSRQCTGFDLSILRHSGIWGAADEAVLNIVHKKKKIKPGTGMFLTSLWIRIRLFQTKTVRFRTFYDVKIAFVRDWAQRRRLGFKLRRKTVKYENLISLWRMASFVILYIIVFDIIILLHVNNAGPIPYFINYRAFFWYGSVPYKLSLGLWTKTTDFGPKWTPFWYVLKWAQRG